jgi:hypothetical protein
MTYAEGDGRVATTFAEIEEESSPTQPTRVCAQCGSVAGQLDLYRDGDRQVWLHPATCLRFWAGKS